MPTETPSCPMDVEETNFIINVEGALRLDISFYGLEFMIREYVYVHEQFPNIGKSSLSIKKP